MDHAVSLKAGSVQTYEEAVWTRRGSWGAVLVGALVGLALTLFLGVLGMAVGFTGGAAAANQSNVSPRSERSGGSERTAPAMTGEEARAAKTAAVGAGIYLILVAAISGFIGGWVAGRVAQVYDHDVKLLGFMTWAIGLVLFFLLGSIGSSGLLAGLGGAANQVAPQSGPDAETVRQAAQATALALWGFVIAQVVGLVLSILGARGGMKSRIKLYPAGIPKDRQQGREYTGPTGTMAQPAS